MAGLEPAKSYDGRFTVSCNCHYATSHYFVDTRGIEPRSQDFQSCAYTMSAKCPLRKQKDLNLRNLFEARPLSRGLVSTTHPYFLSFDVAKLQPLSATYFRSYHFLANFFIDGAKWLITERLFYPTLLRFLLFRFHLFSE